jgi:TonB family protein
MSGHLTEAPLNVFVNPDVPSSFSFFNWIFLDTKQADDVRKNVILNHELAHIRQLHSLDLMIAEVFKAFFWFNPFSWLYHNSLQEVHEYLADREVLRAGTRAAEYMGVLMQQIDLSHPLPISNHFNQSLLKRRFTMITKSKSGHIKALRASLLLPVLMLSCLFILYSAQNTTLAQDTKEKTKTTKKDLATPAAQDSKKKTKTTQKFVATPAVMPDNNSDDVFQVVEDMPQYADGQDVMLKYIGQNVKYPEKGKKLGVEATVYISFVVDKSGNLTKAKVLKAKGVPLKGDAKKVSDADYQAALDEMSTEALRVVNSLPGKWKPGKQGGKAVNVAFTLPIRFNLN